MNKNKFYTKLTSGIFYFSILLFIIAFNFSDNPSGGWYEQLIPDLHGGSIIDITFTDSLTGYAVTSTDTNDISYILKTSNGGDNWNFILYDTGRSFSDIQFINNSTGYASTLYGNSTSKLFKTIDGGNNWLRLYSPGMFNEFREISVVSENELWMTDINVFSGGVFRSTNSGVSWENKYPPQLSGNPDRIYMINSRIGFISNGENTQSFLKKTTDAGDSWFEIPSGFGWVEMNFKDSLTGWRVLFNVTNVQKTTNGGLNWETILLAQNGNPNVAILEFDIINDSIIWGVYRNSFIRFPNNSVRWVIFKTTNNGLTWGYQLPDTSINSSYDFDNTMYSYLSDTLNFNMWHIYAGPIPYYGWTYDNGLRIPFDSIGGNTSLYGSYIRNRISQNSQNDLMTLMTRPVITYFAYGQRSDYQMEDSTKVDPYYFFYTYDFSKVNFPNIRDVPDNTQYGDGEYVKRCLHDRDFPGSNAGLIVSGLKGNKEQANTFWDVPYLGDRFNDWYITPRIRIDSVIGNDPLNQEKEVCKIIITNWDGDSLKQILKVKNFKYDHPDSLYNGKYLEKFYPYPTDPIENLVIPASNWFNPNQSDPFGNNDGQIDFKVYWYDKCDMWIDRIRVENEPARRLLTEPYQPYIQRLEYEINDIALAMKRSINTNYEPYKFYIEEFEMNHLPCIGHVNQMIKALTNDSMSLMVNYNYDLVRAFIPNREKYEFTADMIKRYLIDSAKLGEIFTECYGLEGWRKNDHLAGNNRESYNPPTDVNFV